MIDNRVQITDELRQEIEVLNNETLSRMLFTYDSAVRQSINVSENYMLARMYMSDCTISRDFTGREKEITQILRAVIDFKTKPPMEPGTPEYAEYIQSEAWQQQRNYALDRAKHRCQTCNSPYRLQVHHRTYERLGKEEPEDLTVLCDECHRAFHKYRKLHKDGE